MKRHEISREIGIDMGHRVAEHGSKCRNFHGHRYRIIATCEGPLASAGEQSGMVIDFGFLKQEMMHIIDRNFDHAFCLDINDATSMSTFCVEVDQAMADDLECNGFASRVIEVDGGSLLNFVVIDRTPTAENLAWLWASLLAPRVLKRTDGRANLKRVTVFETPNCSATYEV